MKKIYAINWQLLFEIWFTDIKLVTKLLPSVTQLATECFVVVHCCSVGVPSMFARRVWVGFHRSFLDRGPIFWTCEDLKVQWWESRKDFNFTQLLLLHFSCEHPCATLWGETPRKCTLLSLFGRLFESCPTDQGLFTTSLRVAIHKSHKHLCLQMWSDNTSDKFVPLEYTPAFTTYALLARDSSFVFLFASISLLILPISSNLDCNVRGQQTAGSLISDTSSGDRKWTQKWGRKWQFFHLHLAAGLDLNFSPVLTKANIWAVGTTPTLEIMTCGGLLYPKSNLYKHT